MELESPGLGQGQHPEVFEQSLHELHLVDDGIEALRIVDPVDDRFDFAPDHGERRSQLMSEVGEQAPASLVLLLESRRHPIEGGADGSERARPAACDPHPGVAIAEALGGIDEVA